MPQKCRYSVFSSVFQANLISIGIGIWRWDPFLFEELKALAIQTTVPDAQWSQEKGFLIFSVISCMATPESVRLSIRSSDSIPYTLSLLLSPLLSPGPLDICWCVSYRFVIGQDPADQPAFVSFSNSLSNGNVLWGGIWLRGQQPHSPFLSSSLRSLQKKPSPAISEPLLTSQEHLPRRSRCSCILTCSYSSSVLCTKFRWIAMCSYSSLPSWGVVARIARWVSWTFIYLFRFVVAFRPE